MAMKDFLNLKELFSRDVIAGLRSSSTFLAKLPKGQDGKSNVTAISMDIYPWHAYWALSLRESGSNARYNPAEWKYFEFLQNREAKLSAIQESCDAMTKFWETANAHGLDSSHAAHLIFISAAEALLNPMVAETLQSLGIKAPVVNEFAPHDFEYIVLDSDETVKANYCELVAANRLTSRLLEK